MPRRSGAPLSPNEETTLRCVAQGTRPYGDHAASDVRRLAAFDLIEAIGGKYVLTAAGRRWMDCLLGGSGTTDQPAYGEDGKGLSQFYEQSGRKN